MLIKDTLGDLFKYLSFYRVDDCIDDENEGERDFDSADEQTPERNFNIIKVILRQSI